jgi:hypothetical protein
MLNIGIIGLGPHWESLYRPALARLSRRLRVTAVYDPVASRAERAAQELQAPCVLSMRSLLKRSDVRAVLLLEEAWHGLAPLRFALASGKPMYVSGRLSSPLESLDAVCREAAGQSLVICPELRLRTAPATVRIMELTATQLGAVEQAAIQLNIKPGSAILPWLVAVIDAAGVAARSVPSAIERMGSEAGLLAFQVTFGRLASDGNPVAVRIEVSPADSSPGIGISLTCRQGTLAQFDEAGLRWELATGEETHEQLDLERPGAEVLLDHFARRIVGGLVPIPGMDDVCRILQMLDPHRDAIAGVDGRNGVPH